jgi:HSP20 family protein
MMLDRNSFKNNLSRIDDLFSPLFKNIFDDDFLFINSMQRDFQVDLKENADNYILEADLPGIKKDAIDINYENNYITISAKRDETSEVINDNYVKRERHYGEFSRSFYAKNVDENRIEASFNNGVLKVILPKLIKSDEQKRRIDIS